MLDKHLAFFFFFVIDFFFFCYLSEELQFLVMINTNDFFLHAQKVPQVERHSGSEVSDDLHPAPLCSAPLHPPPLPDEGGNEELCIDDDVVEVKCEQVRFFFI